MLRPCVRPFASLLVCAAAIPLSAQLRTPLDSTTHVRLSLAQHRPRQHHGAGQRCRRNSVALAHVFRRRRRRRHLEDDQWRRDLPARVRTRAGRLDGNARDRAERHDAGLGRHRRTELAQLDLARRRHLQVDRRRPHLEADGAREDPVHRADRRAPDQSEHRLGGGARVRHGTAIPSAVSTRRPTAGRRGSSSKFISDKAGFIDVAIDPSNPDILFASSWERVRGPYFLKSGGPGSALWKRPMAATPGPK